MKIQLTSHVSLFAISLLALTAYNASAQNCDKSLLEKRSAVWKEGIKGSTNNVTAANLATAKATTIESKPSATAIVTQNAASNDNMDKNLLPLFDLDSNQYNVIKIGNQYWFKENLRTTQYNDTTRIATGLSDSEWKQTTKGAYTVFENNPSHESTYGKLYNGYAVVTGKLCPKGWRVPTDNDWKELESVLGISSAELDRTGERGNIGDKLKSTALWIPSEFSNTNSSNFNIVPAGNRNENGEYLNLGQYGNFWTSTVYDDRWGLYLWNRHWHYNTHVSGRIYTPASNGYSCRCIKDNTIVK
jgi:uncharacterized protein (TIGR02145 family)